MFAGDSKGTKRFFSLKWRVAILIIALLIMVNGLFNYFSYKNLENQFGAQTSVAVEEYSRALLDQSRQRLIELGESIILTSDDVEEHDLSGGSLYRTLAQNWELFQISWGVEAAVFLSGERQILREWGDFNYDKRLERFVANIEASGSPETIVYCREQCRLYAGIPLLADEAGPSTMLLATSLADFMIGFARRSYFDLALLRKSELTNTVTDQRMWTFRLAAVTNMSKSLRLFEQLPAAVPQAEFFKHGAALETSPGVHHYFYAIDLQDGSAPGQNYIVLVADVSQQREAIFSSLRESLFISLIGLLCTLSMLLVVLWRPMFRLNRLVEYYPLLVNKDYEAVRQRLSDHKRHIGWQDELDLLEDATEVLSSELELMDKDIRNYTEELESMALYDSLTGLANRRLFSLRLGELIKGSKRSGEPFAVAFIDLDKFKPVNDSMGHEAGDALLIEVAHRLVNGIRATDTAARMGGDEFALLLTGIHSQESAAEVVQKLLQTISQPVQLDAGMAEVVASIGLVLAEGGNLDEEELMRCADKAMYVAKNSGGNRYSVYTRLH